MKDELIKKIEEIVDREVENDHLKSEISELRKMLKTGFETTTWGYERVPKLFATADEKKIKQYYDSIGNQIKAMFISGDLDKFTDYIALNHGINIKVTDLFPNVQYAKNDKRKQKFYDLYSTYFIEDVPKDPQEALDKITKSLYNLTKEYKNEEEPIKDDFKAMIESDGDHSAIMIKTVARIIKTSKVKDTPAADIASEIEDKLNEQMKAIDIIE